MTSLILDRYTQYDSSISLLCMVAALVAIAQPASAVEASPEIVVTARKLSGSAIGDIAPVETLDERAIGALGASNLSEVISLLSALTGSSQGRGGGGPVLLLNGRRISSFSEVRDLPPEAIARVDILPEEVALKYGYAAAQKVVNIVLLPHFRAVTGELEDRFATRTLRNDFNTEGSLVRIDPVGRFTVDLQYQIGDALTEAAFGVRPDPAGADETRYRTLLPRTHQFNANAVVSHPLSNTASATLNGRVDLFDSDSRTGRRPGSDNALRQRVRSAVMHGGTTIAGDLSDWRWTLTATLDRTTTQTRTETASGETIARVAEVIGAADLVTDGTLLDLPSGPTSVSLRIGGSVDRLDAGSTGGPARIARDVVSGQVNLDLPLTGRRADLGIGEMSGNANLAVQLLSDAGTLITRGLGLNWTPAETVSLLVSGTIEQAAPTPLQLGAPLIATPQVRVFDLGRNESVLVTRTTGGNPALTTDERRIVKLGLRMKPFLSSHLGLNADYVSSDLRSSVATFPTLGPGTEAAFPGRFTRDATGRLTAVDARPVNFTREQRQELRWGLNFSVTGKASTAGSIPDRRVPGGGSFGGGHYFGASGRSLQMGLYHTWRFVDRIAIGPGLAPLDLLDGAAVGTLGGVSRHEVELQGSGTANGFGVRFGAVWRDGSTVRTSFQTLRFSDLATASVRLFAYPAQHPALLARHPWLRGIRLMLVADNLLDARVRVTDATGATPFAYQPGYIDATERTLRFSIRKTFF